MHISVYMWACVPLQVFKYLMNMRAHVASEMQSNMAPK